MKILSAEQLRALDKYTITNEPVASIDLMERAALKFTEAITNFITPEQTVIFFCGMGNNGGDGLAIARMLLKKDFKVKVYVIKHALKGSPDFEINETRLKELTPIEYIDNLSQVPVIKPGEVCVDAIFGYGLSKPTEGIVAAVIRAITKSGVNVYSVDVPTGLYCDRVNTDPDTIIQSTVTFTFHSPKLSFLFPQNEKYVPEFKILDIGLSKQFEAQLISPYEYMDDALIKSLFKKRKKFSNKGTYGHALICAGSYGKMGAAMLCVAAALKSGAGLITAHVPKCGYEFMQIANPEAMVLVDSNEMFITESPEYSQFSVVGIGPGIGTTNETADLIERLLRRTQIPVPLVLDADALNILSKYRPLKSLLTQRAVITPHPGEFKRLVGEWKDDSQRLQKQIEISKQQKTVVVLKGAHTSISTADGKVYFNSTGNPGMAKGGSGDVLTGVITSLIAQGYTGEAAAMIGVYVHGRAGDNAVAALSQTGISATDIINYLPGAFGEFE